jgi:hypothetical protein
MKGFNRKHVRLWAYALPLATSLLFLPAKAVYGQEDCRQVYADCYSRALTEQDRCEEWCQSSDGNESACKEGCVDKFYDDENGCQFEEFDPARREEDVMNYQQARLSIFRGAGLLGILLHCIHGGGALGAASVLTEEKTDLVATGTDVAVTSRELDQLSTRRLARLKAQEYELKRQALEDHLAQLLLRRKAAALHISPEELGETRNPR